MLRLLRLLHGPRCPLHLLGCLRLLGLLQLQCLLCHLLCLLCWLCCLLRRPGRCLTCPLCTAAGVAAMCCCALPLSASSRLCHRLPQKHHPPLLLLLQLVESLPRHLLHLGRLLHIQLHVILVRRRQVAQRCCCAAVCAMPLARLVCLRCDCEGGERRCCRGWPALLALNQLAERLNLAAAICGHLSGPIT